MVALEAAGECSDGARCIFRAHHASDRERRCTIDAVRARQRAINRFRRRTRRPAETRVLGAEQETQVELAEIEGHQVDERLRLRRIESIDTALMPVAQARGDDLGHDDAQVDIRQTAQPVPLAEQQRPIGRVDVKPQVRGDDGEIRAGRVDDRARRRRRRSGAGAGHHAGLALLQECVAIEFLLDQRDDLLTAPDAVAEKVRDFLQRACPTDGLVADVEAAIADRGVREPGRACQAERTCPALRAGKRQRAGGRSVAKLQLHESPRTRVQCERARRTCVLEVIELFWPRRAPVEGQQEPRVDLRVEVGQRRVARNVVRALDRDARLASERLQVGDRHPCRRRRWCRLLDRSNGGRTRSSGEQHGVHEPGPAEASRRMIHTASHAQIPISRTSTRLRPSLNANSTGSSGIWPRFATSQR